MNLQRLQFKSKPSDDFVKEIGSIAIKNILKIIYNAYKNLCASSRIKSSMSETEISEELYIEIQIEWKKGNLSLVPIHEKSHGKRNKGRGKTPTIDFCFRARWDRLSYFGAECKLLKEGNKKLHSLYIDEGVNRYISGKYSQNCSAGAMIGYITVGDPTNVANDIKNRIDKIADLAKMKKINLITGFHNHYTSAHSRRIFGFTIFQIHHLFFNFT